MKARLGAGYAAQIQPRRRFLPRLSRRAKALVVALAIPAFGWLAYSETAAQIRLAPLRAARAALAERTTHPWKGEELCAEPVARLLNSLTWWQMWRMSHSSEGRLAYAALSHDQQEWFRSSLDKLHDRDFRYDPAGESKGWKAPGSAPVAVRVVFYPRCRTNDEAVNVEFTYRNPGQHVSHAGTGLRLSIMNRRS
jgi:hypothetical protein